jgi:hypothetical protein
MTFCPIWPLTVFCSFEKFSPKRSLSQSACARTSPDIRELISSGRECLNCAHKVSDRNLCKPLLTVWRASVSDLNASCSLRAEPKNSKRTLRNLELVRAKVLIRHSCNGSCKSTTPSEATGHYRSPVRD